MILTLRYDGILIESKQRPRARVVHGRPHLYDPPDYKKWLINRTEETLMLCDDVKRARCDLILYEFGLSNLGQDGDNTEGAIQDAIAASNLILGDSFLTIPIHTTLVFPLPKEDEFIQVTLVIDPDESEENRYFAYRDRREKLSLQMIRDYRKGR